MAEASADLQRLVQDLRNEDVQAIQSAYMSVSDAQEGRVCLRDLSPILTEIGDHYNLSLLPALDYLVPPPDSSPSSPSPVVSLPSLLEALQTWTQAQLLPETVLTDPQPNNSEMTLQELLFVNTKPSDPTLSRSDLPEKPPSDSTLVRADSQEVAGEKLQWARKYLESNKELMRSEYDQKGAVKTAEFFSMQTNLGWTESVLSQFQSLLLSASSDPPTEDEFDRVFVPTLSTFLAANAPAEKSQVSTQLVVKLEGTIREIEAIEQTLRTTGQDASDAQKLLRTLRKQLNNLRLNVQDRKGRNPVFEARCEKSLHEIYWFYAKQCKMIGKSPSFDEIQHSISILSVGKFLKFLRDFGVLEAIKPKNKKVIDREVLSNQTAKRAFVKTATLQKEMNEAQFKTALDLLALGFYDATYDSLNGTHLAGGSLPEKRGLFYRVLELEDEGKCAGKMKGYGVPFSTYTDYRIPTNDPARGYKYKEYTRQRMTIDAWKNRIQGRKSPSNAPTQRAFVKSKPLSSPLLSPAKKPPQLHLAHIKTNSTGQEKPPDRQQEIFITKPLDDIDPAELADVDSDFDLKDLIAEASSDDEALEKQYPITVKSQPSFTSGNDGNPVGFRSPGNPGKKPKIGVDKGHTVRKSGTALEDGAIERALKVTNAQLEKAKKVQERVEASAVKYKP